MVALALGIWHKGGISTFSGTPLKEAVLEVLSIIEKSALYPKPLLL